MRFVSEAGLLDAHVFAYSKRAGTPAAEYDGQIDEQTKAERSAMLIAECRRVQAEILDSVVKEGKPLPTILETRRGREYTGHSDSYIEVVCESENDLQGRLVLVTPTHYENGKIFGKI
jgi:threonylcarbamoyladenosine tRNA methylthiotransferase MtaB